MLLQFIFAFYICFSWSVMILRKGIFFVQLREGRKNLKLWNFIGIPYNHKNESFHFILNRIEIIDAWKTILLYIYLIDWILFHDHHISHHHRKKVPDTHSYTSLRLSFVQNKKKLTIFRFLHYFHQYLGTIKFLCL